MAGHGFATTLILCVVAYASQDLRGDCPAGLGLGGAEEPDVISALQSRQHLGYSPPSESCQLDTVDCDCADPKECPCQDPECTCPGGEDNSMCTLNPHSEPCSPHTCECGEVWGVECNDDFLFGPYSVYEGQTCKMECGVNCADADCCGFADEGWVCVKPTLDQCITGWCIKAGNRAIECSSSEWLLPAETCFCSGMDTVSHFTVNVAPCTAPPTPVPTPVCVPPCDYCKEVCQALDCGFGKLLCKFKCIHGFDKVKGAIESYCEDNMYASNGQDQVVYCEELCGAIHGLTTSKLAKCIPKCQSDYETIFKKYCDVDFC